jgi:hypothetical protein
MCTEQIDTLKRAVPQIERTACFELPSGDAGEVAGGELELGYRGGDQVDRVVEVAVMGDQRRLQLDVLEVESTGDSKPDEDRRSRYCRALRAREKLVQKRRRQLPGRRPGTALSGWLAAASLNCAAIGDSVPQLFSGREASSAAGGSPSGAINSVVQCLLSSVGLSQISLAHGWPASSGASNCGRLSGTPRVVQYSADTALPDEPALRR